MQWTYDVVDVFTQTSLEGNSLAVFSDARGLDAKTMQRIARELNLSETVFVLPPSIPGAAARVRIFTPVQLVTAGNPNIFIALRNAETVDRAVVDTAAFRELVVSEAEPACLFVFTATRTGAYSRMFAPNIGVAEDPATGSATGPLAAFMMRHGLVSSDDGTRFVSEQGTKMGRPSLLHVHVRGAAGSEAIEVGGHAVRIATAVLELSVDVGNAAA